ncbi:MAG TPA: hypothetical protein VEP91_06725 [Solirubrobacterales bacterium]|nr:hypothetical protein [Solirubrobacterales bacterium]
MTNTKLTSNKPSPGLLRVLRQMSEERGVTFAYPATAAQGRAELARLKTIPKEGRAFRAEDVATVKTGLVQSGDAARVRAAELDGYGSSARWRDPVGDDGDLDRCERCGQETTDRCRIGGRVRFRCADFTACLRRRRVGRRAG